MKKKTTNYLTEILKFHVCKLRKLFLDYYWTIFKFNQKLSEIQSKIVRSDFRNEINGILELGGFFSSDKFRLFN